MKRNKNILVWFSNIHRRDRKRD